MPSAPECEPGCVLLPPLQACQGIKPAHFQGPGPLGCLSTACRLSEVDVSMLSALLRTCGWALRADDPQAMRDFVVALHARAAELGRAGGWHGGQAAEGRPTPGRWAGPSALPARFCIHMLLLLHLCASLH